MPLTETQEEGATFTGVSRCSLEDYKMLEDDNLHLKRIIKLKEEQVQKLQNLVEQLTKFQYESN